MTIFSTLSCFVDLGRDGAGGDEDARRPRPAPGPPSSCPSGPLYNCPLKTLPGGAPVRILTGPAWGARYTQRHEQRHDLAVFAKNEIKRRFFGLDTHSRRGAQLWVVPPRERLTDGEAFCPNLLGTTTVAGGGGGRVSAPTAPHIARAV